MADGDDTKKPKTKDEEVAELAAKMLAEHSERAAVEQERREESMEKSAKLMDRMVVMSQNNLEMRKAAAKLEGQRALTQVEYLIGLAKEADDLERVVELQKQLNKLKDDQVEKEANIDELADGQRNMAKRITALTGIGDSWKSTAFGAFLNDPSSAAAAMADTVDVANVAGSTMMKVIQMTIQLAQVQDKALVSFNRSTGATRKYGDELISLEQDMNTMGVSMEIAETTMTALVKEVYTLESMSASARDELKKTTALLEKFGADATTTAQNVNFLTKAMGVGGTEATNFQTEMFLTAQALGRPANEMAQNFQSSQKQMAKFGKQSTAVFKKLYINAKKAGMEVAQVLSIVEKFDTFDSAADSVGKLNAILGGPFLNSMEMVTTTDPTERMKMLSDAVGQAGVSFDEMGYYQKKALTEAMGLADVSELALMMAGDFDTMGVSSQQSQADLIKLAEQQREFNDISDEYKQIARQFAQSMLPVVQGIKTMMDLLGKFLGMHSSVPIALFALSTAFLAMRLSVIKLNWSLMKGPGAFIPILAFLIPMFIKGGTGAKFLSVGLLLLAAAIWLTNSSIVAFNVATGGIVLAIASLIAMIIGLVFWLTEKQVGSSFIEMIFVVVGSFIALGIAIVAAAYGAPILAVALLGLAAVLGVLALSAAAMWIVSKGLGWIATSVQRMDTDRLVALGDLFTALAAVTGETADNIKRVGEGMAHMGPMFEMMSNPMAVALAPQMISAMAGGSIKGGGGSAGGVAAKPTPLTVNLMIKSDKMGKWVGQIADGRIEEAGNQAGS